MKKRMFGWICILLVVSCLIVGCNGAKKPNPETTEPDPTATTDPTTTDPIETSYVTDENGMRVDGIGSDVKFNGKEITIVGWRGREDDFGVNRADPIEEATYARNLIVEDRLDVNLKFNLSIRGWNEVRYEYIQTVQNLIRMGNPGDCDLIAAYSMCPASFAITGDLKNLADFNQIQFDDTPWWSSDILDKTMINDKVFFASGPISPSTTLEMMILGLNIDLLETLRLDDPRELVREKQWTMDEFFKITQGVYVDLNGNGKDSADRFGMIMPSEVPVDNFAQACGINFLSKTVEVTGKEALILDSTFASGAKTTDLIDSIVSKFATNDWMYGAVDQTRNALFFPITFSGLKTSRSSFGFNYGYLPYPMADEDQGRYYVDCGYTYSLWCMPTSCTDPDCAAYVMECMASEGYRRIQPVIYSQCKFQYSSEEINAEMFDIITQSFTYDYGRLFTNLFDPQSASPMFIFRYAITRPTEKPFTSNLAGWRSNINTTIVNINDCFY